MKTPHSKPDSQDLLVRRSDLEAICSAIEGNYSRRQYDDNGPRTGWECIFCSGWLYEEQSGQEMRHDIDCPVLVARDIRPMATKSPKAE